MASTTILLPTGRIVSGDVYEKQTKDSAGNPLAPQDLSLFNVQAIDTLAREELKVVSSDKKADDVEVEFVGENATVAAAADTVDVEWPSSDDDEA